MSQLLRKHEVILIAFFLISCLYFGLRVSGLTLQPIFADEAIYIRWAQVMRAEPTLRFLPLSDGKPPLFMWLMIPLFKIFDDPLFAGRFLSVLSGYITLTGTLFLGWKFFKPLVGIYSALLVTLTPFTVFFDRMALVDSLLTAFSIWSLNFGLLLIKYGRLDIAMFLGYLFGGGLLTKPPGFFNILALPTSLVIFNWSPSDRQKRILQLFGLWLVAILIAMVMYNLLRLGPGFTNLNSRNQDYVFSPLDLIGRPLDPFLPHLNDLADWLPKLLTWPILILVLIGIFLSLARRNCAALAILAWLIVPLAAQMAFLKVFTARYILASIPPLLCLGGWAISEILPASYFKTKKKLIFLALPLLLFPLSLRFDIRLVNGSAASFLPKTERSGYFADWTAGYGFSDLASFLINETQEGIVVVGTQGSFGTLPDGLEIYLDKFNHLAPPNKRVIVVGGGEKISPQLREAAKEHPTFYIANRGLTSSLGSGVETLKIYPKLVVEGKEQKAIFLLKVLPENQASASGKF